MISGSEGLDSLRETRGGETLFVGGDADEGFADRTVGKGEGVLAETVEDVVADGDDRGLDGRGRQRLAGDVQVDLLVLFTVYGEGREEGTLYTAKSTTPSAMCSCIRLWFWQKLTMSLVKSVITYTKGFDTPTHNQSIVQWIPSGMNSFRSLKWFKIRKPSFPCPAPTSMM